MSLLEQIITRKEQVKENAIKLVELDISNNYNKEYKVEIIWNSAVYTKKLTNYLPELYYLVFWKSYL